MNAIAGRVRTPTPPDSELCDPCVRSGQIKGMISVRRCSAHDACPPLRSPFNHAIYPVVKFNA